MKTLSIAILTFGLLLSCQKQKERIEDSVDVTQQHNKYVSEFQRCQEDFVKVTARMKDESSFDAHLQEFKDVNHRFRSLAATLREASPPSKKIGDAMWIKLKEGHTRNEPTGGAMLGLVTIETRENDIEAIMKDFVDSATEAYSELSRLYGEKEE